MKKLGFGCMRLPMMGGADGEVDKREFCRMVDTFLAEGFCYFDTAHGYLNGKSETALRECLTARYPRESYILTDKLTSFFFEKEDDILPLFEQQLEKTGVSYFDYYLLHALNGAYYEKFTRCNAFEIVKQLKEQGRVKHIGISFHDKPALLERVLDEHPEIEVVQIQFNYADYENPSIESRAVYEVCRRHQKPVIVMEPVKGGGLIQLPEEAKAVLDGVGTGSYASYAVRYAASFEGVFMVLSGMSNYEQLADNVSYWESNVEMTARAFACYVKDRLPYQSDYLVGHAESCVTIAFDKSGHSEVIRAYPQGEERKAINAAFDEIVADLKLERIFTHTAEITALEASAIPLKDVAQLSLFGSDKPSVIGQLASAKAAEKAVPTPKKTHEPER